MPLRWKWIRSTHFNCSAFSVRMVRRSGMVVLRVEFYGFSANEDADRVGFPILAN
jgi:hypothetical protein